MEKMGIIENGLKDNKKKMITRNLTKTNACQFHVITRRSKPMVKFTQNEKAALLKAIAQEKINHDFARVLTHKIKLMTEESKEVVK